ncbi:MAG: hypothetical protein ABI439_07320 [Rhodospirillales bacterium]
MLGFMLVAIGEGEIGGCGIVAGSTDGRDDGMVCGPVCVLAGGLKDAGRIAACGGAAGREAAELGIGWLAPGDPYMGDPITGGGVTGDGMTGDAPASGCAA